jgi:hypothetical protein
VIEILAVIDAITHPKKPYGGVVLWDDKVVEAAPFFRKMKGWSRDRVRAFCAKNGWKVTVVHQLTREGP